LINENKIAPAKDLLMRTPWQKAHQAYTRAGLWEQLCDKEKGRMHPFRSN